jgi:hypothetical protein
VLFDSSGACFHLPPRQVPISISVFPCLISFYPASSLLSLVRFGVPHGETHFGMVSCMRFVLGFATCVRLFCAEPYSSFPAQAPPRDLILPFYAGFLCADCFPAHKECRPVFRLSTCQRRFFLPQCFCCRNIFVPHDKDSFCLSFLSSLVFVTQDSFILGWLRQTAPLLRFESPSFDSSA